MLPNFLDISTVYLIAHVFGAILGAGGAFMSDAMFFMSVKDGKFEESEFHFMRLGGKMVWLGLGILFISGVLLVSTAPEYYLTSSKFLAKATIVGVIVLNGIVFHAIHLPNIKKHLGVRFSEAPEFLAKSSFLMMSGAVSMVSWISTIILGMLKSLPYSYVEIISFYALLLALATIGALLTKKRILGL